MTILLAALLLAAPPGSASAADLAPRMSITSSSVVSPYSLIRGTLPASAPHAEIDWFPEHLEYEVKWGVLSLGFSELEVQDIVDFNGEPAFHIVSRARTTKFGDAFYKVRDLNESWVRAADLVSLGYSKQLREGGFFRDEWVVYDYDRLRFLSKRVNKDQSFEYQDGAIPGEVQDILSSIYHIRPRKLQVGDEIVIDVNTKENWPLVIKVIRKQVVTVPAGKFRTVVVEPFMREEGIFVQKGKRLRVWLTNDKRHIPVLMKVEIVFGHISAYLVKKS